MAFPMIAAIVLLFVFVFFYATFYSTVNKARSSKGGGDTKKKAGGGGMRREYYILILIFVSWTFFMGAYMLGVVGHKEGSIPVLHFKNTDNCVADDTGNIEIFQKLKNNTIEVNENLLSKLYGSGRNLDREQTRHMYNCILNTVFSPIVEAWHLQKEADGSGACTFAKDVSVVFRNTVKKYSRSRSSWIDEMMLSGRDFLYYGSFTGPSFETLMKKKIAKNPGMDGEQGCLDITNSVLRTNQWYNNKFDKTENLKGGLR